VYNVSDVYLETITVSDVSIPASGDSTITCGALTSAWATTAKIYLRGQGVSAQRLRSLADINSSSTTMYGLTTAQFPSGQLDSSTVSWSNEDGGAMIDRIAIISGERPTDLIVNSRGRRKIMNGMTPGVRFQSGTMDIYGLKPEFDGLEIVTDENQGDKVVDFVNTNHWFLHEFYPFGSDLDGGESGNMERSAMRLSHTKYSHELPFSGSYELVCDYRQAFGRMSAIAD
jgi:hypothetical protein